MNILKLIWKSSLSDLYTYIRSNNIFGSFEKKLEVIDIGNTEDGIRIYTLKSSHEYKSIRSGKYESFLIEYIRKLNIGKDKVIIWDLGAHVGYVSILLGNIFKSQGTIVSFEPNPNNVSNFTRNLELNPQLNNIILEHTAVGGDVGEMVFNLSRSKNNPTTMGGYISTALPPLEKVQYSRMGFYSTIVPCTTIDNYISMHPDLRPDIIKIDVEGAELEVLEGGLDFLTIYKPILILEIHHIVLLYKIMKILKKMGYVTEILNHESASPSVCTIAANRL